MNEETLSSSDRRGFLGRMGFLVTNTLLLAASHRLVGAESSKGKEEGEEEKVSPPEDLMREHGALRRVLLVYENIEGRLRKGTEYPPEVLSLATGIVHDFVENYHERLEEDFLFPRFEKSGKLVPLVKILWEQHRAGRRLTGAIAKLTGSGAVTDPLRRKELADKLYLFIRMYRPHAAREDTVLFPALRSIVSEKEFYDLGEQFEEKEHKLLGKGGFEGVVQALPSLEKPLGIHDLSQFTPP